MNFAAHPEAVAEIRDAVNWYESQLPGLGASFLAAIDDAQRRVHATPRAGAPVELLGRRSNYRAVPLRRFPYRLIYLAGDHIFVIAVAHERRRPAYWASRAEPTQ